MGKLIIAALLLWTQMSLANTSTCSPIGFWPAVSRGNLDYYMATATGQVFSSKVDYKNCSLNFNGHDLRADISLYTGAAVDEKYAVLKTRFYYLKYAANNGLALETSIFNSGLPSATTNGRSPSKLTCDGDTLNFSTAHIISKKKSRKNYGSVTRWFDGSLRVIFVSEAGHMTQIACPRQ